MADQTQNLSLLIDLIRSDQADTRPELIRRSALGRAVVQQRIEDAIDLGLVREENQSRSTGGRPSPILRMNETAGTVATAVFGATRVHIAIADLAGNLLADERLEWEIDNGPARSLQLFDDVLGRLRERAEVPELWGIAVGLPGPVDTSAGAAVQPPLMSGWDGFKLRAALERRYGIPAWVDNDANLMALGTWSRTRRASGDNIVLVKAGTGIGAGLISRGRLHRGAHGAAGDIGHVTVADDSDLLCRCGKRGCLEAYASGWAMARDARREAEEGRSAYLTGRLRASGDITFDDVVVGSQRGDAAARAIVVRASERIGRQVSDLVINFNPSTVFLAGNLVRAGEIFRAAVEDAIRRRSPALTTHELVITTVPLQHFEGVIGGTTLALDELFRTSFMRQWLPNGSPRGSGGENNGFREQFDIQDRARWMSELEVHELYRPA